MGTLVTKNLTVNKRPRRWDIWLPTGYSSARKYPMVFLFHGGTSNIAGIAFQSKWQDKADEVGIVLVIPQGIGIIQTKGTWNAETCCGYAKAVGVDDVDFVMTIRDQMQKYSVNFKRLYMSGFSNGAMFLQLFALLHSDIVTAIGPHSGDNPRTSFSLKRKMPVIYFHGADDDHIPVAGGVGPGALDPISHNSVVDTTAGWVVANKCLTDPALINTESWGTQTIFQDSKGLLQSTVIINIVNGMGHQWAGGGMADETEFGTYKASPDATGMMWDFFTQFTLPATNPGGGGDPGPKPKSNPCSEN